MTLLPASAGPLSGGKRFYISVIRDIRGKNFDII